MRILVVEDEPKLAAFLRNALEEDGYDVDVASDGDIGQHMAVTLDYKLILLDWLLPGRDGLSVCRAVREAGRVLPILMLTARDAVEDRIAGLDAGADDYLIKPFALGELQARVRALLRRGQPSAPQLTVDNLVLDPGTRQVTRGAREIVLTAKEYTLLEYLMRNTGRTLTRATIAEHVWDFTFDSGTNVVDVYINYLRNKIDKPTERKLILTVRGIGYRMDNPNAAL
jgi:DNA-binding response OmpR family regulator